uniref:Uncharacterized protein n=1 Tax=Solanum tuberosum TaxID=4113 RepID=M1BHV2_SOLTU
MDEFGDRMRSASFIGLLLVALVSIEVGETWSIFSVDMADEKLGKVEPALCRRRIFSF